MRAQQILTNDKAGSAYIAIIDVLGFKNYLYKNTLDDATIQAGLGFQMTATLACVPGAAERKFQSGSCKWIFYGDTFLLFSFHENPEVALRDVSYCSARLMQGMMSQGWPCRGVITCGELLVADKFTLALGEGLARAHDLEGRLKWSGVFLDQDRITRSQLEGLDKSLLCDGVFHEWGVPTADGTVETALVLGWPLFSSADFEEIVEILEREIAGASEKERDSVRRGIQFGQEIRKIYPIVFKKAAA